MRVIAGKYKGRRLTGPVDRSVRPTTDKVKEAMFSMIGDGIYNDIVLDLFGGTGGLGIEALSRGAAKCYFGDKSRASIKLIKSNVRHCGIGDEAVVLGGSYQKVLGMIGEKLDIIILDPPYEDGLMEDCFRIIAEQDMLSVDGMIIAEHSSSEVLPDTYSFGEDFSFSMTRDRKYGTMKLTVYKLASTVEI